MYAVTQIYVYKHIWTYVRVQKCYRVSPYEIGACQYTSVLMIGKSSGKIIDSIIIMLFIHTFITGTCLILHPKLLSHALIHYDQV